MMPSVQFSPSVVGFEMDIESMLAAADQERTRQSFWTAFWENLWGGTATPVNIPLRASFSENRLRLYLEEEIAKQIRPTGNPSYAGGRYGKLHPGKRR